MTPPLLALAGFALWTLAVLILGVGVHRWSRILTGRAGLTDFPGDMPHGPDGYRRIVRAHANCVESLPVFAAVVLTAAAVGHRSDAFDALALAVLAARLPQTAIHILSGSPRAVALRFAFFAVQLGAMLAMICLLFAAGA